MQDSAGIETIRSYLENSLHCKVVDAHLNCLDQTDAKSVALLHPVFSDSVFVVVRTGISLESVEGVKLHNKIHKAVADLGYCKCWFISEQGSYTHKIRDIFPKDCCVCFTKNHADKHDVVVANGVFQQELLPHGYKIHHKKVDGLNACSITNCSGKEIARLMCSGETFHGLIITSQRRITFRVNVAYLEKKFSNDSSEKHSDSLHKATDEVVDDKRLKVVNTPFNVQEELRGKRPSPMSIAFAKKSQDASALSDKEYFRTPRSASAAPSSPRSAIPGTNFSFGDYSTSLPSSPRSTIPGTNFSFGDYSTSLPSSPRSAIPGTNFSFGDSPRSAADSFDQSSTTLPSSPRSVISGTNFSFDETAVPKAGLPTGASYASQSPNFYPRTPSHLEMQSPKTNVLPPSPRISYSAPTDKFDTVPTPKAMISFAPNVLSDINRQATRAYSVPTPSSFN